VIAIVSLYSLCALRSSFFALRSFQKNIYSNQMLPGIVGLVKNVVARGGAEKRW
jgi:hypothetical protein